MQAEGPARPGPEGGRIVYASRIPPRPKEAQRLGVFDDWRAQGVLAQGLIDFYSESREKDW